MMVQAVKNLPQQQQLLICAATKLLGGGGQDQSAASVANQAAKSGLSALPRKVWLKGKAGLSGLPQKALLEGKPCALWVKLTCHRIVCWVCCWQLARHKNAVAQKH